MKTEKPVYTAICILHYIMMHLLLQKNTERGLFRHKLVAFLPIVFFTQRNCLLTNVIFLDAYYCIKYYSNTIDLTMYELYIFLALNPDCVSGQCPDVSGSSIGMLLLFCPDPEDPKIRTVGKWYVSQRRYCIARIYVSIYKF